MAFVTPGQPDDFSERLYAISVELNYKLLEDGRVLSTGKGRTTLMSSSRVVFEAETASPPGILAELHVMWPVRLAENVGLTLNIFGRTVRTVGNSMTVDILRHEFQRIALTENPPDRESTKAMAAGGSVTGYGLLPPD